MILFQLGVWSKTVFTLEYAHGFRLFAALSVLTVVMRVPTSVAQSDWLPLVSALALIGFLLVFMVTRSRPALLLCALGYMIVVVLIILQLWHPLLTARNLQPGSACTL